MIIKILKGIKRLIFGSTYRFTIRKDSTSLSGASWTEIYHELTNDPLKLISIDFAADTNSPPEYRVLVDGVKVFPFADVAKMQKDTMTFLMPVNVAAGSFLQIEVRGEIKDKGIVILREMAVLEVI